MINPNVPPELLLYYKLLVDIGPRYRELGLLPQYSELNIERGKIHDLILERAEVGRDDLDFALWLIEKIKY